MNTVQRIFKNTFLLVLSEIVGLVLGFLYTMYSARYLGSENYGILSLALAFTAVMWFFMDIGLAQLVLRDVSRDKALAASYSVNATILKLILAALTAVLIVVLMQILNYPPKVATVIYLMTLSSILNSFSVTFSSIFQAFEKMEYLSISSIFNRALTLVGALLAISMKLDVVGFALMFVIVNAAVLIYSLFISRWKFIHPRMEIDLGLCRYMVWEAHPFGVSFLLLRVYAYIAILMMSFLLSDPNRIIGWYNAAYGLIVVLTFIPATLLGALYPIMSNFDHESLHDSRGLIVEKSFKYLMMIALPMGFGVTLLADRIILFVYGPEYSPAAVVLRILIWGEVLLFLSNTFRALLNSTNKQRVVTKLTFYATMLSIIFNLLLQQRYSYVGAGMATFLSELFVLIFLLSFTSRNIYRMPNYIILDTLRILFACTAMSLFIELFQGLSLISLILSSICVYFAAVLMSGIVDDVDIHLLKQVIGRNSASGRVR